MKADEKNWRAQVEQDLSALLMTIRSRCTEKSEFFAAVIETAVRAVLK